jgi:hypothetical protein
MPRPKTGQRFDDSGNDEAIRYAMRTPNSDVALVGKFYRVWVLEQRPDSDTVAFQVWGGDGGGV